MRRRHASGTAREHVIETCTPFGEDGGHDGLYPLDQSLRDGRPLYQCLHILTKHTIHIPAMADIVDNNRNGFRIHFVHDTVIANSKTIEMLRTMKFQRL